MIAIILSIIFPGLGQIYYGKTWRGIIMILLSFIPFAYPFILVWSIIDCINLRKKYNPDPLSRKEAITAIIIFLVVIPGLFLLIITGGLTVVNYISHNYTKPNTTKKEIVDISNSIIEYKAANNKLPNSIHNIVGSRPLRKSWLTDSWNNPYLYVIEEDSSFSIISKGKDGLKYTEDDIKITVANSK